MRRCEKPVSCTLLAAAWDRLPFTFILLLLLHPPPPQLAPFKREVTVSERSALFQDELQLLLLLFVSPSLPLSLSFSIPLLCDPLVCFSFFLIFSEAFFVGVTPLNRTMQPSVKLKLLVSLELLKRGFYTCMHSSPSHTL